MPDIQYRLYFNNNPATREQLDRVEEITVEQEVDMAWEARIHIPMCVDEKGKWSKEDEEFMKSFSRVRVEIKVGENPYVPLIDGPIVGYESQRSSEPGQSSITLRIQDDSVYLNREDIVFRFENLSDHEIVNQIFGEIEQIASTDVEDTPAPPGRLPAVVVQRGSNIQLLRFLAGRQRMHAYVLPGESPGQSIGCFKSFPTQIDGLPPLVLLGAERNMESFNPTNDAQRPARVRASTLSITDKGITTRTSSFSDLDILGGEQGFENESDTATRILPPYQGEAVDLDRAVSGEALTSSYSYEATGSVLTNCYKASLQPYRLVAVKGANDRSSGNYIITKVTHTLSRSVYSQSFSMRRNARSEGAGGTSIIPQGSTNLQASFNFSLEII